MKKILFTIQWYPPKDSANVLCDDKIIQELLKTDNYEIHCLVYRPNGFAKFDIINGVRIHRFSRGLYFRYYLWARENKSKIGALINRIILRIKQILTIPIYPCYEPLATLKYAKEAKKLHKKEKFDIVISEHHGFDSLYAGYKLKKKDYRIKYIPIFWDSLSGGFPAKYLPQSYELYRKKKWENRILNLSDKAIAMKSHEKLLLKTWGNTENYNKFSFLDIPYLVKVFNRTANNETFINKDMITFVFAGSISRRNPQYLIELLAHLPRNDIEFWIICDIRSFDKYNPLLEKYNFLKLHHYISHQELSDVFLNADFMVNFGVNNPNAISGKIFDYMSYGKPIISTYYIDNEACLPYLKNYPIGLCIDERKPIEENITVLQAFIEKNLGKTVAFEDVKKAFPYNLPESYVNLIKEITE